MERTVFETWVVRALIVVLLVSFHWLAYRLKRHRQRGSSVSAPDSGAAISERSRISNEPLEPE
jgi:hypothetical protein